MINRDAEWDKDIEGYFDDMSEEECERFLEEANYQFYSKIDLPILDYLDVVDALVSSWMPVDDKSLSHRFSTKGTSSQACFDDFPPVAHRITIRTVFEAAGTGDYKLAA